MTIGVGCRQNEYEKMSIILKLKFGSVSDSFKINSDIDDFGLCVNGIQDSIETD